MNNAQRTLKGVVSLSGWIAKFDKGGSATVHVDVVFRQGHFGADAKDKVQFRVCLARAEISVRIPNGEALRVIKQSVARTPVADDAQRVTTRKTRGKAAGGIGFTLGLTKPPKANLSAELSGSKEVDVTEKTKEKLTRYVVQHFQTPEDNPGWEVAHREDGGQLDGSPWDAKKEPRLKVRRETEVVENGDKPSVIVEIRCRREDIVIEDLSAKDEEVQSVWWTKNNSDANLAAAEQMIKEELQKAGFIQPSNLGADYAEILIADAVLFEDW